MTLSYDVERARLATSALRCNTQLELDVFKAEACLCVAGYFTVGYAMADADDHGDRQPWLAVDEGLNYK